MIKPAALLFLVFPSICSCPLVCVGPVNVNWSKLSAPVLHFVFTLHSAVCLTHVLLPVLVCAQHRPVHSSIIPEVISPLWLQHSSLLANSTGVWVRSRLGSLHVTSAWLSSGRSGFLPPSSDRQVWWMLNCELPVASLQWISVSMKHHVCFPLF